MDINRMKKSKSDSDSIYGENTNDSFIIPLDGN